MPCFRGIDVSITAVTELRKSYKLPEFPHPEGSSVRLRTPSPHRHGGSSGFLSPGRLPVSPAASEHDEHKANPRISVYIPSLPDSSFYFEYAINKPPSGQNYLFFKVFMNGRHIVSWGIDLRKVSVGTMHRALYEPSELYQQRDGNGDMLTAPRIESRSFKFLPSQETRSMADEGGLIAFQVFRAKGRNGRAPRLEQHRGQEKYGIAIVSDGLLDQPQDTTYYDYHLTDPKDAPYASFNFHYRSWENLEQLHLIPSRSSRLSPTFSSASSSSWTNSIAEEPLDVRAEDNDFSFRLSSRHKNVFDGAPWVSPDDHKTEGGRSPSPYALSTPPRLIPHSQQSLGAMLQPSKATRDGLAKRYLQRPLPELPLPDLPPPESPDSTGRNSPCPRSRRSSTKSNVSITPSLASKLSGDSLATES